MGRYKIFHVTVLLACCSSVSVFGQWEPVSSGTANNLKGAHLLGSGTGFIVGEAGTILKTTDLGATWSALASGTTTTLYKVYVFNSDEGVAVGEQGLILRTTDGGTMWQTVASGVEDTLRSVSFSGVNGICGGDSQTILYSTDSGASWQISQNGFFGGGFPGAQMLSATLGFVAGQNSIFQPMIGATTDGGASWTFQPFYFDNNEGGCTDVFFFNQNVGVVTGAVFDGRGAIARTTDAGMNWSTLFYDQALQGADFPTTDIGFAVGWAGRILNTTDSGVTWTDQTSGTSVNLNDVSFGGNALTGIAVGDGGTILRTTNGGGGPTPTPTPTATPTPKGRTTPTPRPRGTPAPRPTP
jgi:photosystem II stability/assembly factor-like uncharacterized protein